MRYITVHATSDAAEIAYLKSLFQENNLEFRITGNKEDRADKDEEYVQVAENQTEEARKLLHSAGYLKIAPPSRPRTARPAKKGVFIFLAALVLILVAILVTWFMNTG